MVFLPVKLEASLCRRDPGVLECSGQHETVRRLQYRAASGGQHASDFRERRPQVVHMLQHMVGDQHVEAAIRKALLPRLFGLTGLDKAKVIAEKVVEVTRVGLARDNGAKK